MSSENQPGQARTVLHAATLVLISTIHHGIGEIIGRTMSWLNVHVDESPWVARGIAYNQRAYRIIHPWWEAAEQYARWRANQRPEEAHR